MTVRREPPPPPRRTRLGVPGVRSWLGPRRLAAVAVLALGAGSLLPPHPLSAQEDDGELRSVALSVAQAWQAGDVGALAAHFPPAGVGLHTPRGDHPALSARLARAALSDLHASLGTGPVRVLRTRSLGGSPARGFVELAWSPLARGTSEAVPHTVFVGLERSEGAWSVVEIRILPGEKGPPSFPAPHLRDDPWP